MNLSRPLQHIIIICFCLFALLLTSFYGTFVFLGLSRMEDSLFKNQLQSIVEQYLQDVTHGPPDLTPPGLSTYIGTEEMPEPLFELVGRYPSGYHELQFDQSGVDTELQFAIQNLPDSKERIYFIYDVKGVEVSDERQAAMIFILFLVGTLVCCMGFAVGFIISKKIVSPLNALTQKIELFSGTDLPTDLTVTDAPEEINFLGTRLGLANERINQFIIREKEFTRNASHELRTPLTAIQGATELLEKRFLTEQGEVPRPLERILRSVKEMELTVETFLMLAREEKLTPCEQIDINHICAELVDEMRTFINHSGKKIRHIDQNTVMLQAPPQVIRIVIGNLLRNAIQHSSGNCITVRVTDNSLQVSDDGAGMPRDLVDKVLQPGIRDSFSGGTGFGLTIVDRICTRLGWRLDVQSSTETGTEITVLFKS